MTIQDKVENDLDLWANSRRLGLVMNYDSPSSGIIYFQNVYKTIAKIAFNYQVGSSQFVITLIKTKEMKEINIQNDDGSGWDVFWTFIHRNIK